MLHPDHLQFLLTSRQLAEWEAYWRLEPWGFEVENKRAASICATVANFAGKRADRVLEPDDFLVRRGAPKKPSVAEQALAVFSQFRGRKG